MSWLNICSYIHFINISICTKSRQTFLWLGNGSVIFTFSSQFLFPSKTSNRNLDMKLKEWVPSWVTMTASKLGSCVASSWLWKVLLWKFYALELWHFSIRKKFSVEGCIWSFLLFFSLAAFSLMSTALNVLTGSFFPHWRIHYAKSHHVALGRVSEKLIKTEIRGSCVCRARCWGDLPKNNAFIMSFECRTLSEKLRKSIRDH